MSRGTVERLMQGDGLAGAIRGKPGRTTIQDKAAPCPLDDYARRIVSWRASRVTHATAAHNR